MSPLSMFNFDIYQKWLIVITYLSILEKDFIQSGWTRRRVHLYFFKHLKKVPSLVLVFVHVFVYVFVFVLVFEHLKKVPSLAPGSCLRVEQALRRCFASWTQVEIIKKNSIWLELCPIRIERSISSWTNRQYICKNIIKTSIRPLFQSYLFYSAPASLVFPMTLTYGPPLR